jgi:hypothetical protein
MHQVQGFVQMLFNLWLGRSCSFLKVMLPYCDLFLVTSVDCCWVLVNFPCWVPVPCMSSTGGHVSSIGDLAGSGWSGSRVGCMPFREVHCWLQRGLLFWATGRCDFTSALWVLASLVSRLSAGSLCHSGADLLHTVLVLKVLGLLAALHWGSLCLAPCSALVLRLVCVRKWKPSNNSPCILLLQLV